MDLSLFLPSIIFERERIALFPMLDQSGEVFNPYIRFVFGNVLSGFVFFFICFFFQFLWINLASLLERFQSDQNLRSICFILPSLLGFNHLQAFDLHARIWDFRLLLFVWFDWFWVWCSEALFLISSVLNQAIVEAKFSLSRFPVSGMFSVEYRLDRLATAYLWVNQANLAKS